MTIYKAQEMYNLAYSKQPFEQEKEKVMDKIHEAASRGEFQIQILKNELTDYRLIMAWLIDLGYRCICYSNFDSNTIFIGWEKLPRLQTRCT